MKQTIIRETARLRGVDANAEFGVGYQSEREKERREKQIQKKRKEYLVKELEGLLKHEGSNAEPSPYTVGTRLSTDARG